MIDICHYTLSKTIEFARPRLNPEVNHMFWGDYDVAKQVKPWKKCTSPVNDINNGEIYGCEGAGTI